MDKDIPKSVSVVLTDLKYRRSCPFQSSPVYLLRVFQFQATATLHQLDANRSKITVQESLFNYLLECLLDFSFTETENHMDVAFFY